jgi:hypothetical protein
MSNLPAIHILLGCLTNNEQDGEKKNSDLNSMLCNEYERLTNCDGIKNALSQYGYKEIFVHHVTLENFKKILDSIEILYLNKFKNSFVLLNLCDGTETDGYPGMSILLEMEKRKLYFTGSDSLFYEITTSKPILKRVLQSKSVLTSDFIEIDPNNPNESMNQAENYYHIQ